MKRLIVFSLLALFWLVAPAAVGCLPCIGVVAAQAASGSEPAVPSQARVTGPDAAAIRSVIDTGNGLSRSYATNHDVCGSIPEDRMQLGIVRGHIATSMTRLMAVVERDEEPAVRSAFDHVSRELHLLERTLDGAVEMCRVGTDRLAATGYILRMEDDAEALALSGMRLCRELRKALPHFTWPDCDRR